MRYFFLITIVLFSSCKNNKETIADKQQAIRKEMEQVKASYFTKTDSLDKIKEADTSPAKQLEIANELVSAEQKKSAVLLRLQMEYDSLETVIKKY